MQPAGIAQVVRKSHSQNMANTSVHSAITFGKSKNHKQYRGVYVYGKNICKDSLVRTTDFFSQMPALPIKLLHSDTDTPRLKLFLSSTSHCFT